MFAFWGAHFSVDTLGEPACLADQLSHQIATGCCRECQKAKQNLNLDFHSTKLLFVHSFDCSFMFGCRGAFRGIEKSILGAKRANQLQKIKAHIHAYLHLVT